MKVFYIAVFIFFSTIYQSCTVNKSTLLGSVCHGNCYYNNIAIGKSAKSKILGFGGSDEEAMLFEAKRNLYSAFPLGRGEFYDNYSIDYSSSNYIFYSKYQIIISADVVSEGIHDASQKYSEIYTAALNAGKVLSVDHITLSDSVATISDGKLLEGIVLSFNNKNASLLISNPDEPQIIMEFPIKNIFAIGNEELEDVTNLEAGQIIEYSSNSSKKGETIVKEVIGLRKDKVLISVNVNGKISYKTLPLDKLKEKNK